MYEWERSIPVSGKPDLAWAEQHLKGVKEMREMFDRVRAETEESRKKYGREKHA